MSDTTPTANNNPTTKSPATAKTAARPVEALLLKFNTIEYRLDDLEQAVRPEE